jgi:hypothetical protein
MSDLYVIGEKACCTLWAMDVDVEFGGREFGGIVEFIIDNGELCLDDVLKVTIDGKEYEMPLPAFLADEYKERIASGFKDMSDE